MRQPLAQHRDALVQELPSGKIKGIVAAAYLLTPFVPEFGETFAQTGMPSRLFHPVYRSSFRFGATMLRPGMSTLQIVAALEAISGDDEDDNPFELLMQHLEGTSRGFSPQANPTARQLHRPGCDANECPRMKRRRNE